MKTIAPITETDILDVAGPPRKLKATVSARAVTADLVAVLVAVTDGEPRIMTIANGGALPSGPFEFKHRSLQTGLRSWVEAQTGHPPGYVEQLYTFADRGRTGDAGSPHFSSSWRKAPGKWFPPAGTKEREALFRGHGPCCFGRRIEEVPANQIALN